MQPDGHLQGLLLGRFHGVRLRGGEQGLMQPLLEPGRDHLEPEALEQDRRGVCGGSPRTLTGERELKEPASPLPQPTFPEYRC